MKITVTSCFLFFIITFFVSSICPAQNVLEGYIFDETSQKPLPYAAIVFIDTGIYTTSNEDGKFQINPKRSIDSLEVRYLGYETKKVSKDYFLFNKILYLKQSSTLLNEVVVSPNEINLYKLLFKLIKKYRQNEKISQSKAYFTLNSKAYFPSKPTLDTIPLEQIEGFYSSKQQLSKGILGLDLKTGRFGQNRLFPFYSLNYILLLQDFNLLKKGEQFLPKYIGNMSLNRIKKRYYLKLDRTEKYNGTVIYFYPKKEKGDIFSGKIFFKERNLIIEKIELFIKNPKSFKLNSIVKGDSLSIKNLNLNILFNPVDLNKIQYYELSLDLVYYSKNIKRNITSNAILYLYNYNTNFIKPFFTNTIYFENDYDRLLTLPVNDKIWKQNYPYPKSEKSVETTNFFKRKDQFYSYYENKLAPDLLDHIQISSIAWNYQRKLTFKDLKSGPGISLNFSYVLNPSQNNDGSNNYTVKTLFDAKSSFFKSERKLEELEYINLMFDIYELNRHYLLGKIKKSMTLQEVKDLCDKAIINAKVTTNIMFDECCFYEINVVNLNHWKNKIKNELKKYNNL